MRTRVWIVLALAVAAAAAAHGTARSQAFLGTAEVASVRLLNTARAARGVAPLVGQSELDAMARAQAARMATRGQIHHNPNLGADADRSGVEWTRIGENVGVGPDVVVIHEAFLASPDHRDNMLYPAFNTIGVGVAPGTGNQTGVVFVAHVFGKLRSAEPRLPTATAPAPGPQVKRRPVATARRPRATARAWITVSSVPDAVIGGVVDRSATLR